MKNLTPSNALWMATVLLVGAPVWAHEKVATDAAPAPVGTVAEQTQNDTRYMSGGVGEREEESIKSAKKDYNLHATFSQGKTNEYIVDVKLLILDKNGKTYLSTKGGPLVNVNLPAGKYDVIGEHNGEAQRKLVSVTEKGTKEVHFHWNKK